MYPGYRSYPKEWVIGDSTYTLVFKHKIDSETHNVYGECDPSDMEIRIVYGLSRKDLFMTFVHEMAHGIEFEYEIFIPHKLIEKLEEPIAQIIYDNILQRKKD